MSQKAKKAREARRCPDCKGTFYGKALKHHRCVTKLVRSNPAPQLT